MVGARKKTMAHVVVHGARGGARGKAAAVAKLGWKVQAGGWTSQSRLHGFYFKA